MRARYRNVKFSLYPRFIEAFPKKRRGPGEHPRCDEDRASRIGGAVGEAIFHVSMPRNTDNRRVSQSCAAAFATVFVPCAHGTRGHDALCNIEASSSLDCSKLKTDEIVPIFTGGPGNPVQRPRRIFHEIGREISSREDE